MKNKKFFTQVKAIVCIRLKIILMMNIVPLLYFKISLLITCQLKKLIRRKNKFLRNNNIRI